MARCAERSAPSRPRPPRSPLAPSDLRTVAWAGRVRGPSTGPWLPDWRLRNLVTRPQLLGSWRYVTVDESSLFACCAPPLPDALDHESAAVQGEASPDWRGAGGRSRGRRKARDQESGSRPTSCDCSRPLVAEAAPFRGHWEAVKCV